MTVRELIELLEYYTNDHIVILSSDAGGNSYSPLDSIEHGRYEADSTYSGEMTYPHWEDYEPTAGVPAIVLIPTN